MRIVCVIVMGMLCGCAIPPSAGQPGVAAGIEREYRTVEAPPGKARLYVVRDDTSGHERASFYDVRVGDERGTLGRWGWLAFDLQPGSHLLDVELRHWRDFRPLDIDAGQVVFVRLNMGFDGLPLIHDVDEDDARRIIEKRPMGWATNLPVEARLPWTPADFDVTHEEPCRRVGMRPGEC